MDKNFIIFNKEFIEAARPLFTKDNRGLRYGDAVFETLRYHKGIPLFFNDHSTRLLKAMDTLKWAKTLCLRFEEL